MNQTDKSEKESKKSNFLVRTITAVVFSLIIFEIFSCGNITGFYPIAKNIYLWDEGTPEERIIIYTDEKIPWNINSGIPVVPSNRQFQENCQNYKNAISEYVVSYSYSKEWLIAHTVASSKTVCEDRYWILHLPQTQNPQIEEIEDSTIGPLNRYDFEEFEYMYLSFFLLRKP